MTDRRFLSLFLTVGDPNTYPEGTCTAWVESADRPCGKPADYLCARHVRVAERRMAQEAAKEQRRREKREADRREHEPVWRERLAKVEARLDRIDPLRTQPFSGDTAMVNVPLSKRLPSESRIHELSTLHEERDTLRRTLGLPS